MDLPPYGWASTLPASQVTYVICVRAPPALGWRALRPPVARAPRLVAVDA